MSTGVVTVTKRNDWQHTHGVITYKCEKGQSCTCQRYESVYGAYKFSSTYLDLGARWRSVVNVTARPIYARVWKLDPPHRRILGPNDRLEFLEKQKSLLPKFEIRAAQPVAKSAYRLSIKS